MDRQTDRDKMQLDLVGDTYKKRRVKFLKNETCSPYQIKLRNLRPMFKVYKYNITAL